MPGLIEYLTIKTAVEPQFTINSAVNTVDIVANGVPILGNGVGDSYFTPNDGITILDFGVVLPYQFGPAADVWNMLLSWINNAGDETTDILNTNFPGMCGGNSLAGGNFQGVFSAFPAFDVGAKARLRMTLTGDVSMVNVPSALTGVLNVHGWVKIQHNIALTGAP